MSVYEGHGVTLHHGDCLDALRSLPDCSVDSVVTDPPYNLTAGKKGGTGAASVNLESPYGRSRIGTGNGSGGFMGKAWDDYDHFPGGFYGWCEAWATECLRVLKPGGHLLAFGGTRTWHRLACAVEDAGFEVRDSIAWLYGSGFPKSLDVGKAIDKAVGATGTYGEPKSAAHAGWIDRGRMRGDEGEDGWQRPWMQDEGAVSNAARRYLPGSTEAQAFAGWGTALKPAFEPVVVARKPIQGTVAANVLAWGTGALNVDGCRIGEDGGTAGAGVGPQGDVYGDGLNGTFGKPVPGLGRWPANVVLDETQAEALDEQSGTLTSGLMRAGTKPKGERETYGQDAVAGYETTRDTPADSGGASRFFYVAKADASERPRLPKRSLRLRDDLTPEQVDHVRARLVEAGVQVD